MRIVVIEKDSEAKEGELMKVLIDGVYYTCTAEPVTAINFYGHTQIINPNDYRTYNFTHFRSITVNNTTLTRDKADSIKKCQCMTCENANLKEDSYICSNINPFDLLDAVNGECKSYRCKFKLYTGGKQRC